MGLNAEQRREYLALKEERNAAVEKMDIETAYRAQAEMDLLLPEGDSA